MEQKVENSGPLHNPAMQAWATLIDLTSRNVVDPLLSVLGVSAAVSSHEIAASLLIAALQLCIIAFVFRPLESWIPAERWADRRLTRVDRDYTLLMVLGVLPLPIFLAMTPLHGLAGGDAPGGLLQALPWLDPHPYLRFLIYYLVFDFTYYWMHRAEHAIPWFWALHSLHHSQRQVSCWTNNRDSFVSGAIEALILASVGVVLGVEPSEFALLMLAGELVQNFSHANARVGFGPFFGRLLVGPEYHRLHHMHVDYERPGLHNCNFSQAFPVWDLLFGTALYGEPPRTTGVTDPVVDADNDRGLIGQQFAALRRFRGAFLRRSGWKLGDVSFGEDYEPIKAGD